MANYVSNKVVCSKNFLDTYLIDFFPLGPDRPMSEPHISFNKLFGLRSLSEYQEKIGVHIYYGFDFSWSKRDDGQYEVKFCTRWEYPIQAILKALELSHEVEWFAVEESSVFVSKFYWDNGAKEDIMPLMDAYFAWSEAHMDLEESLKDWDDSTWYYLQAVEANWKNWKSKDGFQRYRDTPVFKIMPPIE